MYEVKLKVLKDVNGTNKEMAEHYIVEGCELCCEVEAKALELYNGQCDVFTVFRSRIKEIVNKKEEDKPFFRAVIIKEYTNDDGSVKEMTYPVLVCAEDLSEANTLIQEYMKQGLDDMRLKEIKETKILDVL